MVPHCTIPENRFFQRRAAPAEPVGELADQQGVDEHAGGGEAAEQADEGNGEVPGTVVQKQRCRRSEGDKVETLQCHRCQADGECGARPR
ncbi:hypothetical protein ABZ554_39835 [Streptomyces sp. NPDC020125]|uniref:hypothetical protein n=1 Tax=Streptomyces sp. NPDC020125 TaxID=3154593 RepID=UPI0033D4088B